MQKLFFLGVIGTLFISSGYSQFYFENDRYFENRLHIQAGVSMGGMNCFTDLGGKTGAGNHFFKDLYLPSTKYCFGVMIAVDYLHKVSLQIAVNNGNIEANDAHIKKDASLSQYRRLRNLHFKTNILEAQLLATIYPLALLFPQVHHGLSPCIGTGIAIYYFNPLAKWNNYWVPLHALHTEGLGLLPGTKQYQRTQLNIPIVIGCSYALQHDITLQIEGVYRKLFTDYLDDVSTEYRNPLLFKENLPPATAAMALALADRRLNNVTTNNFIAGMQRGNRHQNDSYFSINLSFKFTINSSKRY